VVKAAEKSSTPAGIIASAGKNNRHNPLKE
jgi:hypothetical protein